MGFDILSSSFNASSAKRGIALAQPAITAASAAGALSAIGSVNLTSPTISSGIPSASTMSSVARAVEKAATDLKETTVYNAYVNVFDTIKLIAESGNYSYELKLTQQQQTELTPLLTKYGYTVDLVNNANYNVIIKWGKSTTVVGG